MNNAEAKVWLVEIRRERKSYRFAVACNILAVLCFAFLGISQFGKGDGVSGWIALGAAAANVASAVLTMRAVKTAKAE